MIATEAGSPGAGTETTSRTTEVLVTWETALGELLRGGKSAALVFQPILDLKRGRVVGYEALARFQGPPDAPPDVWFREARHLGCAEALEQLTLKLAVAARNTLPPKTFLSINVSPGFFGSPLWAEFVASTPNLERLVIEVTERQAISDYEHVKQVVADIRHRGAQFAVDDAGSDYASLQNVLALRPDYIKLDRNFITGCDSDPAKSSVIEMLREFAAKINAGVVAEGLETEAELRELLRLDTPLAQGYLLGRPASQWTSVDPALSLEVLYENMAAAERLTVGSMLEKLPTVTGDDEGADYLMRHPRESMVAVVDSRNRISCILDRDPAEGVRLFDQPMIVESYMKSSDTLAKATARSSANRFDPIAVVDAANRFLGIVRMDSLIRASLRKK